MGPILFPETRGRAISGELGERGVDQLRKALEAGYGSDVASLTGGGALRIQSLDMTMMATVQENKHFRLFNALPKTDATATVDEWTEQDKVGGFRGGSTNSELGVINSSTGSYARRVGTTKYLMTRREVSFVQTLQGTIADSEAIEQNNGAMELLTDAEHLCFEGDSSVVPTEFDGIYRQIVDLGSTDHVIDMAAASLNDISKINNAAAAIAGAGNYGIPTDLYLSYMAQADLDSSLDPAYRVAISGQPNDLILGAPVAAMRTSFGQINNCPDVFVRDEAQQSPFELEFSIIAAANSFANASIPTGVAASDASSKFGAAHAGNYYYAVAGINNKGQSVVSKSAQIAVVAGNKVTLTITASASGAETGYVIYRSRKNGTNATNDFRECARVAKAGSTTTWVDLNREIPGTSKAYMLNLKTGMNAITWRQLLPMIRFDLYPTNTAVKPWAQLLFGYLRLAKRKQHVVFKNILPNGAVWRPFG